MPKGKIWREFEKEFGKPFFVLPAILVAFLLPSFLFFDKIRFLPEVFVTEWMKAFSETILLLVAARFVLLSREKRRNMIEDLDHIEGHLIYFIAQSKSNLEQIRLEKDDGNLSKYNQARLFWTQGSAYIRSALYLELKSKTLILKLMELVHETETGQCLDQLDAFFLNKESFELDHTEFSISSLNTILNRLKSTFANGDSSAI